MPTSTPERLRAVLLSTLAACLVGAALGAAPALAVVDCPSGGSSSWTNAGGGAWDVPGNWTNGVPGTGCAASITLPGTYAVVISDGEGAQSLALGAASGTQTLRLEGNVSGGSPRQAIFSTQDTLAVGVHGVVELTSTGADPGAAILGGGLLDNSGRVVTETGGSGADTFKDIRANVTNEPGGTISFDADTSSCGCGSGGTWINKGLLETAAGTSSRLSRSGAGISFSQPASTGQILDDGHLTVDGTTSNADGTVQGANPVTICGSLDPSGPGAASFDYDATETCNSWSLTGDVGAATTVLADNLTTAKSIVVGVPQATVNRGTVTLDGVAGSMQTQLVGGQPFSNLGRLVLRQPGSGLVTVPVTNTGTVSVAAGSSVEVRNGFTQAGGTVSVAVNGLLHVDDDFDLTGGSAGGPGEVSVGGELTHTGGSSTGAPLEVCQGGLDAPGPGTASFLLLGPDAGCSQGHLDGDIGAGDTVEIRTATSTLDTFFATIVNHGTLRLDGGGLNQLHGTKLTNEGTFALTAGTANQAFEFVNDGTFTVAPSTTMNFGSPVTLAAGSASVDGTLGNNQPFAVTGGTLSGTGTINADLDNSGGTVHPGHSPGVLAVTGDYTQAAGGTLAVDVSGAGAAGTGFGQLAVTGAASLAGRLAVTDPAPPAGTYRVLVAASLTGTFSPLSFTGPSLAADYDATGLSLVATTPPPPSTSTSTTTPPPSTSTVTTTPPPSTSTVTTTPPPSTSTVTTTPPPSTSTEPTTTLAPPTDVVPVASQTTATTAPPPPVLPSLTGVSLAATSFTAAQGTTLRLTLTTPGTVTIKLTRRVSGRRVGASCRAKAKRGKRCHATVTVATLTRAGTAGANSIALKLPHLRPGRYTLKIVAAGVSRPVTTTITVKPAARPKR